MSQTLTFPPDCLLSSEQLCYVYLFSSCLCVVKMTWKVWSPERSWWLCVNMNQSDFGWGAVTTSSIRLWSRSSSLMCCVQFPVSTSDIFIYHDFSKTQQSLIVLTLGTLSKSLTPHSTTHSWDFAGILFQNCLNLLYCSWPNLHNSTYDAFCKTEFSELSL